MRFRPCIDLYKGSVVQIVGNTYRDNASPETNFVASRDASWFADLYKNDHLNGGHVVMLGSGSQNAARTALQAFPGGLHAGGGMTPDNAGWFLDAGASHIIMTSYVFRNGIIDRENLERAVRKIGKTQLVLDLSCTRVGDDYMIVTDRWQKTSTVAVSPVLLADLACFCDEFLVHAAHVEGMRQGIDRALVELLGLHSPIPVTYAGGIRSIQDLEIIKAAGRNRVDATAGSALDIFGGTLRYRDIVRWHHLQTGSSTPGNPQTTAP